MKDLRVAGMKTNYKKRMLDVNIHFQFSQTHLLYFRIVLYCIG